MYLRLTYIYSGLRVVLFYGRPASVCISQYPASNHLCQFTTQLVGTRVYFDAPLKLQCSFKISVFYNCGTEFLQNRLYIAHLFFSLLGGSISLYKNSCTIVVDFPDIAQVTPGKEATGRELVWTAECGVPA